MNKLAKKRRWLLVPCPDYDVPAMESWLEAQAEKGFFLSKDDGFFLGFACFEVGAPGHARYRLDAAPKEKLLDDFPENKQTAIDLAQEMGWECIAEWKEFLIYRCADETLPELNTDPAVQALSLKRVQKALSMRIFNTCYYLFLYPLLLFVLRVPSFLLGILTFGTLRFLALLLLTIVQTAGAVRDWRQLKKLRSHLQAGGQIAHTNGWRDGAKRCLARKLLTPVLDVFWLLLLFGFVLKPDAAANAQKIDVSAAPVPTLCDFAALSEKEKASGSLTLSRSRDLLAPEICHLSETRSYYSYSADLYKLRAPWLAKWLANDLRRYDESRVSRLFSGRRETLTECSLPPLEADTALCYKDHGLYRLLLQKDSTLLSVSLWWPAGEDFPAETIARTLLAALK